MYTTWRYLLIFFFHIHFHVDYIQYYLLRIACVTTYYTLIVCSSRLGSPIIIIMSFPFSGRFRPRIDEDSLLFHTLRDSNVIIINDGKTAHRPK